MKNLLLKLFLLSIFSISLSSSFGQGFVKASGKNIVDARGNDFIARGYGMGGWLVLEGYMFDYAGVCATEWELLDKIKALVGDAETQKFLQNWRKNFLQKKDVDSIAKWGFNCIRLPMHHKLFTNLSSPNYYLDEGFTTIDSLLKWCRSNKIYLILDLHAAPGGQGKNTPSINDYNSSQPDLWSSADNQTKTAMIWTRIAQRYANDTCIAGYDLINETHIDLPPANLPLKTLYKRITDSVRVYDKNHLLFIEGNWYANDFNGLTPAWDNNMAYSFHKYWNGLEQSTIQWVLDIREKNNVPLWLGETGENSNSWFTGFVNLCENNKIGWSFWPHKKINTSVGPLTLKKNPGWQMLMDYFSGKGTKPTTEAAITALKNMTDNLEMDSCFVVRDVMDALFRQTKDRTAKVYREFSIPGIINATDFDMGPYGVAYNDADYITTGGSPANPNQGGLYRNDGVDIQACSDNKGNGYNVGWMTDGEWMQYSINVKQAGTYTLVLRCAGTSVGQISIDIDGARKVNAANVPATGAWQTWKTYAIGSFELTPGKHKLKLIISKAGYNLNYLELVFVTGINEKKNEKKVIFSPNPATGQVEFMLQDFDNDDYSFVLTDINGKVVINNPKLTKEKFIIERNNIPAGMYFFKINGKSSFYKGKLMFL
jgi:endoglucanase